MKIINFFRELETYFNDLYNTLVQLNELVLKLRDWLVEHNKNFDKMFPTKLYTTWVSIIWAVAYENTVVQILNNTLIKDYFTNEFLNKEATTTKLLFIVDWWKISEHYFKLNSELWKDYIEKNWAYYLIK
jgi:hypothetical protein